MKSQGLLRLLPSPGNNKTGWPWTGETNTSKYLDDIVYPKISVVTISYNQAKYLEDAILSVLNQNYPNLEYFVIDGGSTDGSIEIIKKYSDRLTYWCSEKDNGPASALNKGFSKATGDIFYYLNSDDVLLPNIFFEVVKFIDKNSNYDVYYGHGFTTRGSLEEKYPVFSMKWDLNQYRLGAVSIFQQSTFIRSNAFRKINGFNERNTTHWDGELLVDLELIEAKFKRFNIFTAIFRIYPESITGNDKTTFKYLEERKEVEKRILSIKSLSNTPKILIQISQLFKDPLITFKRLIFRNIYPYS